MAEVLNISITGYGLKFVISALITPVLYCLNHVMRTRFNLRPVPLEGSLEEE